MGNGGERSWQKQDAELDDTPHRHAMVQVWVGVEFPYPSSPAGPCAALPPNWCNSNDNWDNCSRVTPDPCVSQRLFPPTFIINPSASWLILNRIDRRMDRLIDRYIGSWRNKNEWKASSPVHSCPFGGVDNVWQVYRWMNGFDTQIHYGIKVATQVEYWYMASYLNIRESLYSQVIIWLHTILKP